MRTKVKLLDLCLIFLLQSLPFNVFQIANYPEATWRVTENSDFIIIENNFYKAEIRKDTLYNHKNYGEIEHLYIKPSGNDVSPPQGSSIMGLGGHEYMTAEPIRKGYYQFHSHGDLTPIALSVIENEPDYCVVYNKFVLGAKTVSQYYIFYKNQPYYLTNVEHEWNIPAETVVWQNQMCFLIAYQWADTLTYLDQDGTVKTYTRPLCGRAGIRSFAKMPVEQKYQTYAWAHYYNTTFKEGIGFIFLDVLPRGKNSYVDYWIDSGAEVADYTELQLSIGGPWGYCGYVQYNSSVIGKDYYSYIVYVIDESRNLTYLDVQTLAKNIWVSNHQTENAIGFAGAGKMRYDVSKNGWGDTWGSYACRNYFTSRPGNWSYFRWVPWGDYPQEETIIAMFWQNSTGSYQCFDNASVTAGYNAPTADFANITWSNSRETLTTEATWEYYNDSDKAVLTVKYTINGNLTMFRMGLYFGGGSNYTYSQLNSTVWKGEKTDLILGYEGILVYYISEAFVATKQNALEVFCVNNGWNNDKTYTNESFEIKLWLQPYISFNPLNVTLMQTYDGLRESYLNEYDNHYVRLWNTTNSFSEDFQVLDFINGNYNLLYHNYDDNSQQLTLTFNGISTRDFTLNCSSKGKPVSVGYSNGTAIAHTYNSSTKQLTFKMTLSTRVERIRINWSEASEVTHPAVPTVLPIELTIFGLSIAVAVIYILNRRRKSLAFPREVLSFPQIVWVT